MPLSDVDLVRRRFSVGLPSDGVDFVLYSYNEYSFEETCYQSVSELLHFLENEIENDHKTKDRYYWIEVINHSCVALPNNIKILCEHFDIHPLIIEDITTLAPYMKLDLFHHNGALYMLMKILTWNGQRVEQQQISFYLSCSQNLLITFQEKPFDHIQPFFQTIRNRLRRRLPQNNKEDLQQYQNTRLRQLNVDYLFYCLLDDIIDSAFTRQVCVDRLSSIYLELSKDLLKTSAQILLTRCNNISPMDLLPFRYMSVMEEIADRISQFDDCLMTDSHSRTLPTLYSIYRLKHDLLHLRILFNPLKEIITRLQRATFDDPNLSFPRTDPTLRLGLKHHIVRRQPKTVRPTINNDHHHRARASSIYLNEYIYVYFKDLNNHIDQLIDTLEIQRESVSILISFWITLNSNETQEILQILMLITVLFMPCTLLTGMNSTNFYIQAQLEYRYGYYIILSFLALILIGMITWYKVKHWI